MTLRSDVREILVRNGWIASFATSHVRQSDLYHVVIYDNYEFPECSIAVPKGNPTLPKGHLIAVEMYTENNESESLLRMLPKVFVKTFKEADSLNKEIIAALLKYNL